MIAAIVFLCSVVLVLGIALVFARQAAQRAADRAAMDFANAMASEIKRKTDKLRAESAMQTVENTGRVPAMSDADLEREINK